MKNYSVIIAEPAHQQLQKHLVRKDGQEDLCFATYTPSTGSERTTAIISELIFPGEGDRDIHGNVGFMPQYFERAMRIAVTKKQGLVFLHSHPVPGWQGMSSDDVIAESRMSPAVMGATSLPLVGMTIGTDGAWSARFWLKNESQKENTIAIGAGQ